MTTLMVCADMVADAESHGDDDHDDHNHVECDAAAVSEMAKCQQNLAGSVPTTADVKTMCDYSGKVMACYPKCFCDDTHNAEMVKQTADGIAASAKALGGTCEIKCGSAVGLRATVFTGIVAALAAVLASYWTIGVLRFSVGTVPNRPLVPEPITPSTVPWPLCIGQGVPALSAACLPVFAFWFGRLSVKLSMKFEGITRCYWVQNNLACPPLCCLSARRPFDGGESGTPGKVGFALKLQVLDNLLSV
jgi:hypothetical protein